MTETQPGRATEQTAQTMRDGTHTHIHTLIHTLQLSPTHKYLYGDTLIVSRVICLASHQRSFWSTGKKGKNVQLFIML